MPAWIFVFDLAHDSTRTPDQLVIVHQIATSAEAIAHQAARIAPDAFIAGGATANIAADIRSRIRPFWPDLFPVGAALLKRSKGPAGQGKPRAKKRGSPGLIAAEPEAPYRPESN